MRNFKVGDVVRRKVSKGHPGGKVVAIQPSISCPGKMAIAFKPFGTVYRPDIYELASVELENK